MMQFGWVTVCGQLKKFGYIINFSGQLGHGDPSGVGKSSTGLACLAGVKAGHVHLCWVVNNIV